MRTFVACVVLLFSIFVSSGFAQEMGTEEVLESRSVTDWSELVPVVVSDFQAPPSLSPEGAEFIKALEGFRAKAYRDSHGYSIGYGFQTWQGRRTTRSYPGLVTQPQADAEFIRQIAAYENIVIDALDGVEMSQHEFDALVSIAFNCGVVNRAIIVKLQSQRKVVVADFMTTARVRNRIHPIVYGRRLKEYVVFIGRYEDASTLQVHNWSQMHKVYRSLSNRGVPYVAASPIRTKNRKAQTRLLASSRVSQVGHANR